MRSILHIGYPKTATTTLQNYFSTLKIVTNVGKPLKTYRDEDLRFLWSPLDSEKIKISNALGNLRQHKAPFILSEELILGSHRRYSEQKFLAKAFYEVIPDCKVIITVRKQYDILKSMYCSWPTSAASALGIHIKNAEGLIYKNPSFEDWVNMLLYDKADTWGGLLFYNEIVNIWSKVYGNKNLVVVPYEAFTASPNLVDDVFQNSLGLNEKLVSEHFKAVRLRDRRSKTHLQKIKNNIRYMIKNTFKNGMPYVPNPDQIKESKKIKNKVMSVYSESNNRLQNFTDFNLKELGYYL